MPLDIDRFAHRESSIQRWDPRLKIFSLGVFIFGISLLKTIPLAFAALGVAVLCLCISRIPVSFIAHGMKWVIMFLIPFIIILPLTFSAGESTRIIGIPFRLGGLRLAILIFIKAIAIVLTTYAIFGSARFNVSMIAIQRLRCPKIIIQIILFTYRYIFLFLEEMKRMDSSMRSRGFVPKTDLSTLRFFGNFVGTLLVRSFERTIRVYNAMLSKGYNGEFHTLEVFEANGKDFIKAAMVLIITFALLAGDIFGPFSPAMKQWF